MVLVLKNDEIIGYVSEIGRAKVVILESLGVNIWKYGINNAWRLNADKVAEYSFKEVNRLG